MKQLDELIYDAICADDDLMDAIGGRVESTCFEVSPEEQDNTPVPYLIVMYDGFQSANTTKDTVWEGDEDSVKASVEIAGVDPKQVHALTRMVRRAVNNYVVGLSDQGETTPELQQGFPVADGIAWDWLKPCYYQHVIYQCNVENDLEDEQEE